MSKPPEDQKTPSQRLREAKLKNTRPRQLVLSLLQELDGHYSADELCGKLQERQTPLSRASVYNTLDALVSRGLIMMADAGPGPALYERGRIWHHHFVCRSCGIVINIPCVKGEKPCLLPEFAPGSIEEAQIIFRGYCQLCLLKQEKSE